jgi:hypothetical protein
MIILIIKHKHFIKKCFWTNYVLNKVTVFSHTGAKRRDAIHMSFDFTQKNPIPFMHWYEGGEMKKKALQTEVLK